MILKEELLTFDEARELVEENYIERYSFSDFVAEDSLQQEYMELLESFDFEVKKSNNKFHSYCCETCIVLQQNNYDLESESICSEEELIEELKKGIEIEIFENSYSFNNKEIKEIINIFVEIINLFYQVYLTLEQDWVEEDDYYEDDYYDEYEDYEDDFHDYDGNEEGYYEDFYEDDFIF